MSQLAVWGAVGALGALGALARFILDVAVARRLAGDFPWGTTTVNMAGALLAGVVSGAALDGDGRTVLAVGLLGSFSTFSTWMLESHRLAEEGRTGLAGLNLLVGVPGLAAAGFGWVIGGLL